MNDDLISRAAAIDALGEEPEVWTGNDEYAQGLNNQWSHDVKALKALPSAQPDVSDINVGDMISREVLIEELNCINLPVGNETVDKIFSVIENMPSAQPEPIRINLNEPIKVKLTDWGKEIYYHQYDRTNQIAGREICKPRFPREDENGYTEFQLWCFMELYGEHIGITLPNVIEPLEIVYER